MDDYYALLGVRPNASREEIARSYRRLARTYHPDLRLAAGPEARWHAEEMLKRINRAYGTVGDPRRRVAYDRERALRVTVQAAARPRTPTAPQQPAPAQTTSYWGSDGRMDIEWTAPPSSPRAPRPDTDGAWLGGLLRGATAIVVFAVLLALLGRPVDRPDRADSPTLRPTATQSAPAPVSAPTPEPTTPVRR